MLEMRTETEVPEGDQPSALATMLAGFLGPEIMQAFRDPDVTEIYVNPDGLLWLIRHSEGRVCTEMRMEASHLYQFINSAASSLDQSVTAENPSLQAELPKDLFNGARLQAEVPPVVARPTFNLRKPPTKIYSLESYVENGTLSAAWYKALRYAVKVHWNIVVAGPTHSGKTTFCNALIKEMADQCPRERFVLIEDTRELQCAARDVLDYRTAGCLSMADLVKRTLRRTPDRIIVGEVRDEAALQLLEAWSTGHPGGCGTLHASSPEGALNRLDRLCRRANVPSQMELIAESVDLVVVIKPVPGGRRVTDMARVEGLNDSGQYIIKRLTEVEAEQEVLA